MPRFRATHRRFTRSVQGGPRHSATSRASTAVRRSTLLVAAIGLVVTAVPAISATAADGLTSQFDTFFKSGLQSAKGTPAPASGSELVLPTAGSYASTTVIGSGQVKVSVRGSVCPGVTPQLSVSVDGADLGTQAITSKTAYQQLVFGSSLAGATHTVRVTLTNDAYVAHNCDVNAYVAGVTMDALPAATPPASTAKPGPGNTGVPAGTALTVHNGDLTVTKDGTVIDALDIHGGLYIKANDVTITRTLIRGGAPTTRSLALVAAWWGYRNIKISDSTLRADNYSLYIDGLSGSNFTATRLDISRVVDTVKVIGSNVTLQNSWTHDNFHSDTQDPYQPSGSTHDDSVQVEGGMNILISRNSLNNAHNSAVMLTQNNQITGNLRIANNWISGGACSVNMTERAKGGAIQGSSIQSNRFGLGSHGLACPMLIPASSPIQISGNVWDATGAAAVARRF